MSRGGEVALLVGWRVPILVLRLVHALIDLLWRRARSAAVFRRELRRQGMGWGRARRLATLYSEGLKLRRLVATSLRELR